MDTAGNRCSACRYRAARYRASHYGFELPFCSESCSELFHDLVAPIGPRMQGKRPEREEDDLKDDEEEAKRRTREKMRKLVDEMELALKEVQETAGAEAAEAERRRAVERLAAASGDDSERAKQMEIEEEEAPSPPHAYQPSWHSEDGASQMEEDFDAPSPQFTPASQREGEIAPRGLAPLPRIVQESDLNYWQAMPVELRVAILSGFPIIELLRYARVSRGFQYFLDNNDDLWRNWLRRPAVAEFYGRVDVPSASSQPRMRTWHDEAMVYLASCDYVVREPARGRMLRMAAATLRPDAPVAHVRISDALIEKATDPFSRHRYLTHYDLISDASVGLRLRNVRPALLATTNRARVVVTNGSGNPTTVVANFLLEREVGAPAGSNNFVGRLLPPNAHPSQNNPAQVRKMLKIHILKIFDAASPYQAWGRVQNVEAVLQADLTDKRRLKEMIRTAETYSMAVEVVVNPEDARGKTNETNSQAVLTHAPCLGANAPRTCRPLALLTVNFDLGLPSLNLYSHLPESPLLRQYLSETCEDDHLRAACPLRAIFRVYLTPAEAIPELARLSNNLLLGERSDSRRLQQPFLEAARRAHATTDPLFTFTVTNHRDLASRQFDALQLSLRTLVINLYTDARGVLRIDAGSTALLYQHEHPQESPYVALADTLREDGTPGVVAVRLSTPVVSFLESTLSRLTSESDGFVSTEPRRPIVSEVTSLQTRIADDAAKQIASYWEAWRSADSDFRMLHVNGEPAVATRHLGFVALYPARHPVGHLQPTAFVRCPYLGGMDNLMTTREAPSNGDHGYYVPPSSHDVVRGGPLHIARPIGDQASRPVSA